MVNNIVVSNITKTFRLSKKQQKIEKTTDRIKVAVDNLSFEAFPGEIYGLLGPNGAGKTTCLRCISTLIKPDSGEIYVGGYSVKNEADQVRKKIGFLTTDLKIEDFFTPNYLFDYFSRLHRVEEKMIEIRKKQLFERFQVDKFAEVKVGELSSGMRQKAQIAISLVHDPDIIIFDEPTNGLDVLTAKTVTDYLLELKDLGKTIIISTHIFSLVEKICDRVGIILNGSLKSSFMLKEKIKQPGELEEFFFNLVFEEEGEVV